MKDEEKNEGTGISNPRLQKRDSDRGATSAVAAVVDRGRAWRGTPAPTDGAPSCPCEAEQLPENLRPAQGAMGLEHPAEILRRTVLDRLQVAVAENGFRAR